MKVAVFAMIVSRSREGSLSQCSLAERDLLDEPAGSQISPSRIQFVQHGPDPMLDLLDYRPSLGVVCQQRQQRWLVDAHAAQQLRPRHRQSQCDATTKRIADQMHGRELQVFDQCGEVGKIIIDRSISRALAVSAAVVAEYPERSRDLRARDIPVVMVQQ